MKPEPSSPPRTEHHSQERVLGSNLEVDLVGLEEKRLRMSKVLDQIREKVEFSVLKWEKIDKELKERAMELDVKEKSVMERLKEVEEREKNVGLLEKSIAFGLKEKEKEIEAKLSLESSLMRLGLEKEKKQAMEELKLLEEALKEKEEKLNAKAEEIESKRKELELKEKKLEEEEKEKEFEGRSSMRLVMEELEVRGQELKSLEEALKEKEEILNAKAEEIESKRKELELKEKKLEEEEKEKEFEGRSSKRPKVFKSFEPQPRQSQDVVEGRRICRAFSVFEVEALVQAVEKLGTRRWRDVKLCAFEDVDHRTNTDLKDKWKTLVHTAKILPQQRRGEPVPQVLLDRVLNAHSYWLEQQQNMN